MAPQTKPAEEKKEEASDAVQSIAVRQKLKELESEIDKFRTENAVLAKMRTEREEVRENLLWESDPIHRKRFIARQNSKWGINKYKIFLNYESDLRSKSQT